MVRNIASPFTQVNLPGGVGVEVLLVRMPASKSEILQKIIEPIGPSIPHSQVEANSGCLGLLDCQCEVGR